MEQPVLHTNALSIGYIENKRQYAVHTDVNLNLLSGEMVCLVGPNGSGKSTLLRTLAGLQKPLAGTVNIQGKDLFSLSSQEMALLRSVVLTNKFEGGYLTVRDVVAMGRYPFMTWLGKLSDKDEDVIDRSINQAGLSGMEHRVLQELSDGELQRAMIAKALSQESPLILLDEPTAHLDLPNRVAVMKLLRNLARETGSAIVISTHELDLALQSADRFWLMTDKNEVSCGMPEELALSGAIATAFNSENVHFDSSEGVFVMHKTECGTIGLEGSGEAYFWTKKALERNGFVVGKSKDGITISEENKRLKWDINYSTKSQSFSSLHDVIQFLINA